MTTPVLASAPTPRPRPLTARIRAWALTQLAPVALVLCAPPIVAQSAYSAAGGPNSIISWRHGFLGADFSEIRFGLTFVQNLELGCATAGCGPDQIHFALHGSASARIGEPNLFSKLDFLPGYDVAGRVGYVLRGGGPGYDALYLGFSYRTQERDLIIADTVADTRSLTEVQNRTFSATLGFNHALSDINVFGLAVTGARGLRSPGAMRAQEFCTPGRTANGFPILVCSDRFPGPLPDLWSGQARADLQLRLVDFGTGEASTRLGMAAATSVNWLERADPFLNIEVGPALFVRNYPGLPVASLLLGFRDVFDANPPPATVDLGSWFRRSFLARLSFTIPYKVLTASPSY